MAQLAGIRLMRAGLARMVAGLRGAIGIAAIASALVSIEPSVSLWWLVPVVAAVACWTSFYVVTAWTRGLRPWLIGVDLLLTALLCLAIGKIMPPSAIPGTLNWVATIASMAVISGQLAGMPALSVPAGLLVTVSYVAGARLAHSPDGGAGAGLTLASQAVLAAAVMVVGMRAERAAVRVFAELEAERTAAELAAARRKEERFQQRVVHNGPVTTLAMALHADTGELSTTLRHRAAVARDRLLQLAVPPRADDAAVRLDERLAQVVLWYQPPLAITATLPACSVPADVAEAFAGAAGEALENVVRHAGTRRARIVLADHRGTVQVTIADAGRGFDAARPSAHGFGLREDIPGRMTAVGGSANVASASGTGAVVRLEWRRG